MTQKKFTPTAEIQFYTVNLTVLPPSNDIKTFYYNLISRLYNSDIIINHGAYFYKITKLDKIETSSGNGIYGIISKYVSLADLEWVEDKSDSPVEYAIPGNIKGRRATHEFVFYPESHRFAFMKRGKIEQSSKRGPAPLKAILYFLKHAFDLILEDENKFCEVNLIQSNQIFDEIYSSVVKSMDLTVSYSNPGIGDDHEQTMDEFLRKAHLGKTRIIMSPDSTGQISTDAVFTKGLIDLARENGKVKAKIETIEGSKFINTEDHPEIKRITVARDGNIEIKFFQKILEELKANEQ
jgi:hypothetical protein